MAAALSTFFLLLSSAHGWWAMPPAGMPAIAHRTMDRRVQHRMVLRLPAPTLQIEYPGETTSTSPPSETDGGIAQQEFDLLWRDEFSGPPWATPEVSRHLEVARFRTNLAESPDWRASSASDCLLHFERATPAAPLRLRSTKGNNCSDDDLDQFLRCMPAADGFAEISRWLVNDPTQDLTLSSAFLQGLLFPAGRFMLAEQVGVPLLRPYPGGDAIPSGACRLFAYTLLESLRGDVELSIQAPADELGRRRVSIKFDGSGSLDVAESMKQHWEDLNPSVTLHEYAHTVETDVSISGTILWSEGTGRPLSYNIEGSLIVKEHILVEGMASGTPVNYAADLSWDAEIFCAMLEVVKPVPWK